MDNTTSFESDGYDSQISCKNFKKLRLGILLNNYNIKAWEYSILETITSSDYASIDLVILNECVDEKISFKNFFLSNRDKLLYYTYTKLEDRFCQSTRAFTPVCAKNLLKNVPVLGIKPKMDKYYDCFQDQDIERIKGFNLDVILQCGFRTLKGDILNVSKYGVWSYHHDDIHLPRGSPPGFWETFERTGERGVVLQILTEDLNKGIVIYRSSFPCDSFFVSKNNNHCFLRSSSFVPRALKKLYCDGENTFLDNIEIENKKLNFNNEYILQNPNKF